MRILFLDDDAERHEYLSDQQFSIMHCWTDYGAISSLDATDFDLIMLDHDLGYDKNGREMRGENVSNHLVKKYPRHKNAKIIIHSMNRPGAERMALSLRNAGFEVHIMPGAWKAIEISNDHVTINVDKIK